MKISENFYLNNRYLKLFILYTNNNINDILKFFKNILFFL